MIVHRDTLAYERLGKLVLDKEPARSLAKTFGQLPETADGTGATGSGIRWIMRSGRQLRMRQCPDFEYFLSYLF